MLIRISRMWKPSGEVEGLGWIKHTPKDKANTYLKCVHIKRMLVAQNSKKEFRVIIKSLLNIFFEIKQIVAWFSLQELENALLIIKEYKRTKWSSLSPGRVLIHFKGRKIIEILNNCEL